MKELLNRLKSPVVISNIVGAVVMVLINLGIIDTGDTIQSIANAAIGILIAVGVLNNPTDKENW